MQIGEDVETSTELFFLLKDYMEHLKLAESPKNKYKSRVLIRT